MKTYLLRIFYRSRFRFLGTIINYKIKQSLPWYKKYYTRLNNNYKLTSTYSINLFKGNFKVSWCILIKVFTKTSYLI